MRNVFVSLSTTELVQEFVRTLTKLEGDFELVSGNFVLDARSLMGIFSMDISCPILLRVYNDIPQNFQALSRFIIASHNVSES